MDKKDVPYIVFESTLSKEERHSRRLVVIILILILAWISTIGVFLWYITLPVEEVTTSTQTIDGVDNSEINQTIGDDENGESNAD